MRMIAVRISLARLQAERGSVRTTTPSSAAGKGVAEHAV
jgi:hypothetical protein